MTKSPLQLAIALALASTGTNVGATTFGNDKFDVSLSSTVSLGTGIRTANPACTLVLAGASGAGAPAGCLAAASTMGDQGNLNYARGDAFTTYLKGVHELLVKMPDENITLMTRVAWARDFSATRTTGFTSVASPPPPAVTDGLTEAARSDLRFKARVLDLWVSKSFDLGEQRARVRVGNQVVTWGEGLFIAGGINAVNAMDFLKLSQPGTQLKEAILPAPMVSFATGLGGGVNLETYVQTGWRPNYLPPTGSYWSTANGLGKGDTQYGLATDRARNGGQWGASLRYQPEGTQLNLGLYGMNYHDKGPAFSTNIRGTGVLGWAFPEDRKLIGLSANLPLGDWAVGAETSYRPRDAVALNSANGCLSQKGNCWVDSRKIQTAVTGMYAATPNNAKGMLDFLHASTATLMVEAVAIQYPRLRQNYGGDPISAGGWGWGQETDALGQPRSAGSKNSYGYNFDFSWVSDGNIIPGWQVIPEIYFFHAVKGRTPNIAATFMEGAKSANLTVSFVQNPANWQVAVNYAKFWGGSSVFDQPLRDRNFVGVTISRNL